MADTNEEQLLSGLLRGIACEDISLEAAHLESRVLASAFARTQPSFEGARRLSLVIAAAAVVAVLLPALFWLNAKTSPRTFTSAVDATEEPIAEKPAAPARKRSIPTRTASTRSSATRPSQPPNLQKTKKEGLTPSITQSPDEFLPLMPMTEQELTGSFQIVSVQMPRASLGALRSPLEHPNELVEADVLLSEDGMARAIRLSTSGSIQPWRSR